MPQDETVLVSPRKEDTFTQLLEGIASSQVELRVLALGLLKPNPWNPNKMAPEKYESLKQNIKNRRDMQPIVVRPVSDQVHPYEIIDGEHRWRAAQEVGETQYLCLIVPMDDTQARLWCLTMNNVRGQPIPVKLANVLHELNKKIPETDLNKLTGYSTPEIRDYLSLLKLPQGLEETIKKKAEEEDRTAPVLFRVMLTRRQSRVLETALTLARKEDKELPIPEALVKICLVYRRIPDRIHRDNVRSKTVRSGSPANP